MVGLVFVSSGCSPLRDPAAPAKSIAMSKAFSIFLGIAELAGGFGLAFGVLTQLAAFGLDVILCGAIDDREFLLAHRLLGREGLRLALDLIFVLMNPVIACPDGGAYVLIR